MKIDKMGSLLKRLGSFTNPEELDTTYLTHGLHSYPAKYIPQLPEAVIMEHTNERNTVLDPFCGSGTTLLEASLKGRKSIGVDSNPIAALVSKVKTTPLNHKEIDRLYEIIDYIKNVQEVEEKAIPNVPNINHWFQQNMVKELSWLKDFISHENSTNLKDFLRVIFSSIIVSVSNQESDTRYAAKEKNLPDGYALKRFVTKLKTSIKSIEELSTIENVKRNPPKIFNLDSREVNSDHIPDNSVDLVVTSPPYANSYDYYLYHKLRMSWLGYDFVEVKEAEIGSRNEHSSRKQPVQSYIDKMIPVMKNVARVLKPNKLAYFFIGDSIISGEYINMKDVYIELGKQSGLKFVDSTSYSMEKVSRYFQEKKFTTNKNKIDKKQWVLVFEPEVTKAKKIGIIEANAVATEREVDLFTHIKDKEIISINSNNNSRHVHSIGKYPSKFIPDIPNWAINKFTKVGDTVLDPFMGSGTTAVEAMILGRNVIGTDISPYATLLTRGKTTRINTEELDESAHRFVRFLENPLNFNSQNRLEFKNDDFWFNLNHLNEFEEIRAFIVNEMPESLHDFYLSVISMSIKKFSYLDEAQIKVKRDAKKVLQGTKSPRGIILATLQKNINRLKEFNTIIETNNVRATVYNKSADVIYPDILSENSVDLIVTSPPYINAMNYSMTNRYEDLLLRLIDVEDSINHQTKYFGTERVYAEKYNILHQFEFGYKWCEELNPLLAKIYESEPKRSYITYEFFLKMFNTFNSTYKVLKPGGRYVVVAGTNTIRQVPVDTFGIMVKMLEELGMEYDFSFYYEIIKNALKLTRNSTANKIKLDGVGVLKKI
ncbi:DNA methyltransferase [Lysinibacillus sphaericus]|uniref:site-specific DNA-methyltransferase n=1 Tax=Lysinibacillus sphaericus TaxID=1421 RepID=UPI0021625D9D|nr:site-specific DNA-methyltransferase [Lysinibacillus sphaericus]MCS1384399.1 DNA methyltransferase [Lysinibacillus sphaericus]